MKSKIEFLFQYNTLENSKKFLVKICMNIFAPALVGVEHSHVG